MARLRPGLALLGSTGFALVLAGCTFLVHFDDDDDDATGDASVPPGSDASIPDAPSVDAPSAHEASVDDSADSTAPAADATSPDDGVDAADAGFLFTLLGANAITGEINTQPPGKPPPGSTVVGGTSCDPCDGAGGASGWYCAGQLRANGGQDCGDDALMVYCTSADHVQAEYACPTNVACVPSYSFFEAFCDPCGGMGSTSVCDDYDNSSHPAYLVACSASHADTKHSLPCSDAGAATCDPGSCR